MSHKINKQRAKRRPTRRMSLYERLRRLVKSKKYLVRALAKHRTALKQMKTRVASETCETRTGQRRD